MRVILIALLAFAAATNAASIYEPEEPQFVSFARNIIDNLIRQALEFIRKLLKENEPYTVPNIPDLAIKDQDLGVDINVQLKNVKVSQASDFTVDEIENNLPEVWAKFQVSLPKLHLEGDYVASGVVQAKKVNGQGKFTVDLMEFVQKGFIQAKIERHQVQLETIDLDYDLKDLKFDLAGLTIEGMTQQEIDDLLHKKFVEYLQTNKKDVTAAVSKHVKDEANKLMAGKSLKQILDWLKDMMKH